MSASSFDRLAQALGQAFAALGDVVADPQLLETALAALGWAPPPGVDLVTAFAFDVDAVTTALATVVNSTDGDRSNDALMTGRYAALAAAIVEAVGRLDTAAAGLPQLLAAAGDYAAKTDIVEQLPIRLLDSIVAYGVQAVSPLAAAFLHLVGVFRSTAMPEDDSIYQVAHNRVVVEPKQLSLLVDNPTQAAADAYGWATSEFDAQTLLDNALRVMQSLGGRGAVTPMPVRTQELVGEAADANDSAPTPQLLVELLHLLGETPVDVMLSIHRLRSTTADGADAGLEVAPYARGATDQQIALTDALAFTIDAALDLEQGVSIALRPSGVALRSGLLSGTADEVSGDLTVGLEVLAPVDGTRRELLSGPGGIHIAFLSASIQVGLEANPGSSPDAYARAAISGGQLSVASTTADGFLRNQLPPLFVVDFEVGVRWSKLHGLHFEGSGSLNWHVPAHVAAGPLRLTDVHLSLGSKDSHVVLGATVSGALLLGPITVSVRDVGVAVDLSASRGSLGPIHLDVAFKPPSGIGLTVTAPLVSGGGFLDLDPERGRYAGGVQLAIQQICLAAVGLVATKADDGTAIRFPDGRPGYSLVVVIAATFPPIQLGLGFALAGIGGLLGYNRTLNVDALRSGVRTKALDTILFPANPAGSVDRVVSTLSSDFPVALGRLVVGPMVRLTWGEPVVATIDLAVLIELPAPVRVVLLGRLRLALPRDDASAVIRINLDAVGVADFGQGSLSLDATIYDSKIGPFALAGDMALRLNWKGQRRFLLSIGGWHPAYAAPPDFPSLRRITLSLTGATNVQFSVAAYFAVTSNTVQFGGRADVKLSGGGFALTGMISLDTLITLNPFGIRVDFAAALAISFEGVNLLAVAVSGTLSGPGPWHVHATATVTLLGFSRSVLVDTSFGPTGALPAAPDAVDVLDRVQKEVASAPNWQATPTSEAGLLRLADVTGDGMRVSPLSTLAFHQRVAPLGVMMTRFGPAPLTGARSVSVQSATIGGVAVAAVPDVRDDFAPANFLDLTDAQKLASPAFVSEPAGATLGAVPLDLDDLGAADAADLRSVPDFTDPLGEAPITAQGRRAVRRVTPVARTRVAAPARRRPGIQVRPGVSAWPLPSVRNG